MLETFQRLVANQFEAAFCTLNHCVRQCPETLWQAKVANNPFSQSVFHTLFFTDYYLGPDAKSIRDQPFHRENPALFGDYEQLEPREPTAIYEKQQIDGYLAHCRQKAKSVIVGESAESLAAPAAFGKNFSRAELHVYNIRHIQHHSAQLILRLRQDTTIEFPWFGSGWRDLST